MKVIVNDLEGKKRLKFRVHDFLYFVDIQAVMNYFQIRIAVSNIVVKIFDTVTKDDTVIRNQYIKFCNRNNYSMTILIILNRNIH